MCSRQDGFELAVSLRSATLWGFRVINVYLLTLLRRRLSSFQPDPFLLFTLLLPSSSANFFLHCRLSTLMPVQHNFIQPLWLGSLPVLWLCGRRPARDPLLVLVRTPHRLSTLFSCPSFFFCVHKIREDRNSEIVKKKKSEKKWPWHKTWINRRRKRWAEPSNRQQVKEQNKKNKKNPTVINSAN